MKNASNARIRKVIKRREKLAVKNVSELHEIEIKRVTYAASREKRKDEKNINYRAESNSEIPFAAESYSVCNAGETRGLSFKGRCSRRVSQG